MTNKVSLDADNLEKDHGHLYAMDQASPTTSMRGAKLKLSN